MFIAMVDSIDIYSFCIDLLCRRLFKCMYLGDLEKVLINVKKDHLIPKTYSYDINILGRNNVVVFPIMFTKD